MCRPRSVRRSCCRYPCSRLRHRCCWIVHDPWLQVGGPTVQSLCRDQRDLRLAGRCLSASTLMHQDTKCSETSESDGQHWVSRFNWAGVGHRMSRELRLRGRSGGHASAGGPAAGGGPKFTGGRFGGGQFSSRSDRQPGRAPAHAGTQPVGTDCAGMTGRTCDGSPTQGCALHA